MEGSRGGGERQLLRAIFEHAPDAVLIADGRGTYVDANQAACALLALPKGDIVGRGAADFVLPDGAQSFDQMWEEFLRRGSRRGWMRLRRADGEVIRVEYSATADVVPGRHLAVLRDAAGGRRMRGGSPRESEERLRIAVEAAEMATWVWDLTSDEVTWNERHFTFFGLPPTDEPLTPRAFFDRVHRDDKAWLGERLERAVETNSTFEAEFRVVRKDSGEERWMAGYGRAVEASSGKPTRMAGVMSDITERKRREGELRRAHDELEDRVRQRTGELEQMTGVLFGEVKERAAAEERVRALLRQIVTVQEDDRRRIARELHDTLGQQLAALRWSIDALKANAGEAAHEEEAERARGIFERLNADVDFLAWELRPAELDQIGLDAALRTFVSEWSRHFGVAAGYRGQEKDASRFAPEVETNLYRILQEALQNVHKHAGATRVSVLLERRGGRATLIVEDDGRGYDADTEVEAGTSKGMGVANMRERAALVGGELEIESTPGAGTTVYVRVPIGVGAPKQERWEGESRP